MLIKCKSNIDSIYGKLSGLTINEKYKVISIDKTGYKIIDNNFNEMWYCKDKFYNISYTRSELLNELGI